MDLADEEGAGDEDLFIGEGGEDQPRDFAPTKDEVLFLIDGSQRMFGVNEHGEVPLFLVLEAVVAFLKDKVIAAGSDNVGIVLYHKESYECAWGVRLPEKQIKDTFIFLEI